MSRHTRKGRVTWAPRRGLRAVTLAIAALFASEVCAAGAKADLVAAFAPGDRRLELRARGGAETAHELRLLTSGLTTVERSSDVNEPGIIYLPPATETPGLSAPEPAENVFFFNELADAPGWELVIRFAPADGTWKLNGRFSPLGGAQRAEVVIPVTELEHGENLLHLAGRSLGVPEMFFRRQFPAGEPVVCAVEVIPGDWSGRVQLHALADGKSAPLLDEKALAMAPRATHSVAWPEQAWSDRARLSEAAVAVGRNLLSGQVRRSGSRFAGGFNLVYDPLRKAHRMPHWLWAWGPSIDYLLRLAKTEAARDAGLAAAFRDAAIAAGRRSLRFEVTEPGHPARGISTVRWEPSKDTPLGWAEYMSTADSLFMAGWGWMSLHAETGESIYLTRMQSLVDAAERLMAEYPVIPQDWIVERKRWTPHTLDESVFGTIGFRRLHEATGSASVADAGRRFLDSHLKHMGRESGILARGWMREEDREIWDPDIKGHAWVIEGYLDAHRLSGDAKYLELSRQLAEKVIACQSDDGSWTYLFKRAEPGDVTDDKGTAIWAYLFYDLYKSSRNPAHLAAARKALGWCLHHQYRGDDPNLDGAIFHPNGMAYVRRRPMTILYTTTFFGLALLEELALTGDAAR